MFRLLVYKAGSGGGGGNFPAGITSGAPADAIVNAAVTGLDVRTFSELFNGVTWDRLRDINATQNTTGTGLVGAGVLGYDGANYQRITSGPLADNTNNATVQGLDIRNFTMVFDGTNWDIMRSATAATGTTGTGLLGFGILAFDGTNFNRVTEGVPADAVVNANIAGLDSRAFAFVYNGTTWDRAKSATAAAGTTGTGLSGVGVLVFDGTNFNRVTGAAPADAVVNANILGLDDRAFNFVYNGTTWDRIRSIGAATSGTGTGLLGAGILAFDNTNYVRLRNGAAANISSTTQPQVLCVTPPGEWSQASTPAANTQATTSKAAGGAGVRHICKGITVMASAIAAITGITFNLRDGATGAGTILWSVSVELPVGGLLALTLPCNIFGSANTAMTLESSGAPGATNFVSVSMNGYSTV